MVSSGFIVCLSLILFVYENGSKLKDSVFFLGGVVTRLKRSESNVPVFHLIFHILKNHVFLSIIVHNVAQNSFIIVQSSTPCHSLRDVCLLLKPRI